MGGKQEQQKINIFQFFPYHKKDMQAISIG